MSLRTLVTTVAVGAAGFALGVLTGPSLLDDANDPGLGAAPPTQPVNPTYETAAPDPVVASTAGRREPVGTPSAVSPDVVVPDAVPATTAELKRLREQVRLQAADIRLLENQVARTDTAIVATQIARRAGVDVDELEMMLDDRRLIGSLQLLTSTAQETTIHNLWTALQLEAEYLKHVEHLEHNGPPIGSVASDAARQRFRDYRTRVIRPWIDNNLETLCTRFRNLGIPQPLIDDFRRRSRQDR